MAIGIDRRNAFIEEENARKNSAPESSKPEFTTEPESDDKKLLSDEARNRFIKMESGPDPESKALNNLSQSYGGDADKAAKYQSKLKELGLPSGSEFPEELVDQQLNDKKKREFVKETGKKGRGYLNKFYADKANANAAWDDSTILGAIVDEASTLGKEFREDPAKLLTNKLKAIAQAGTDIAKLPIGTAEVLADVESAGFEGVIDFLGMGDEGENKYLRSIGTNLKQANPFKIIGKGYEFGRKEITESGDYWEPETDSFVDQSINEGVRSMTNSSTFAAGSMIAGIPQMALPLMIGQAVTGTYGEDKDKGMDLGDRLIHSSVHGAIEWVTEQKPVEIFQSMFKAGGKPLKEKFMKAMITENIGEQVATLAGNAWDTFMLPEHQNDPEAWDKFFAAIPENMAKTLIATTFATAGQTGIMAGTGALHQKELIKNARAEHAEYKKAHSKLNEMIHSEADQKKIDNFIKYSQEGLLNTRDPKKMEAFVAGLTEDDHFLYVPADKVSELEDLPDYIEKQLDGTGADVEIPLEKFMTEIATNEQMLGHLRPHVRLTPDGYSLDEIANDGRNAVQEMVDQAKASIQEADELEVGYQKYKEALLDTGRIDQAQSAANAALIKAYVQRIARNPQYNMSITEAFDKLNVAFTNENTVIDEADTEVIDQSEIDIDSEGNDKIKARHEEIQGPANELISSSKWKPELDRNKKETGRKIAMKIVDPANINWEANQRTAQEADRVKPVSEYKSVPEPATPEAVENALQKTYPKKVESMGKQELIKEGAKAELRLDIPSYFDQKTWVVSITSPETDFGSGKTAYGSAAKISNVTFGFPNHQALTVAGGIGKAPFAKMKGSWNKITPEEAKAQADAALKDPAWIQVGMDPERRAYFYNRGTMQHVVGADEVIQVGPLVLAKNPQYGSTPIDSYLNTDQLDVSETFNQPFWKKKPREEGFSRLPKGRMVMAQVNEKIKQREKALQNSSQDVNYQHEKESLDTKLQQWTDTFTTDNTGRGGLVSEEWSRPSQYTGELGETSFETEASGREQQAKLIAAAKENGFFYDYGHPLFEALDQYTNKGGEEHDAYIVGEAPNQLVLRNTSDGEFGNTSVYSPVAYLKRLEDYNQLFPHLQIQMVGVHEDVDGNAVIITAQQYVHAEEYATHEELDAAMRSKGWFEVGANSKKYMNKETGAVISDVHKGNVLHNGSDLFPIDVIVDKMPVKAEKTFNQPAIITTTGESSVTLPNQREADQLQKRKEMVKKLRDCLQG